MSDFAIMTKQLEQCAGKRIFAEIRSVELSYRTFAANSKELLDAANWYQDAEAARDLWALGRSEQLEEFVGEVMRFLHNYLASVKSLVDHSRRIVRGLCDQTAFWTEYQGRVEATFMPPLPQFVQGLRNYALHRDVPITGVSIRYEKGKLYGLLRLDLRNLRQWDGWTTAAQSYLAEVGRELSIADPVEEYFIIAEEFHEWLIERLQQVFALELEAMQAIRCEIAELVAKAANGKT